MEMVQLHSLFTFTYLTPPIILPIDFPALGPDLTLDVLVVRLHTSEDIAGVERFDRRREVSFGPRDMIVNRYLLRLTQEIHIQKKNSPRGKHEESLRN